MDGGIEAWKKANYETDSIATITADELAHESHQNPTIFDVRALNEYRSEHVENAINVPLSDLNDKMATFKAQEDNFYIHCKSGYRSMIAASILKARGIHNFIDINGGFEALAKSNIAKTEFVCPTTLS
ncbi:MAG: rhodanese-like domain-containing protein [Chitinophagales bacterium]